MIKLDESLLKKYAQVMVHYGLNNGRGMNKGETVFLVGQECSKNLFTAIAKEIYTTGGNVITQYLPNNIRESSLARFVLENGNDEQISFFRAGSALNLLAQMAQDTLAASGSP